METEDLAVKGLDLVADLFQERLKARVDATGVNEPGELVEVVAELRQLLNHRQGGRGGNFRYATAKQEMAHVSR
jgi:hypothetical protein